jgi:hypothetical protein
MIFKHARIIGIDLTSLFLNVGYLIKLKSDQQIQRHSFLLALGKKYIYKKKREIIKERATYIYNFIDREIVSVKTLHSKK